MKKHNTVIVYGNIERKLQMGGGGTALEYKDEMKFPDIS